MLSGPINKKKLAIVLAVLVLAALSVGGWNWLARRGSPAAVGTYMAGGGQTFVRIEPGSRGQLVVPEGLILANSSLGFYGRPETPTLSADWRAGRLVLFQRQTMDAPIFYGKPTLHWVIALSLTLEPSPSVPGDWDLLDAQIRQTASTPLGFYFSKDFRDHIHQGTWLDDFVEFTPWPRTVGHYALKPGVAPLRSFLHRVDDPRLADYYHARLNGEDEKIALGFLRELSGKRPDDVYLLPHRVELEAATGQVAQAERYWQAWEKASRNLSDPLLGRVAQMAWKRLSLARLNQAHPNLMNYFELSKFDSNTLAWKTKLDLAARLQWYKEFLGADQLMTADQPIVPSAKTIITGNPIPNFLDLQTQAKVNRVLATFDMIRGQRAESLDLLAASYRMGQSLNADGGLISRLIGIAIRAISNAGLVAYALNACETPEEIKECWAMLERLRLTPGQEGESHLFDGENSALFSQMVGGGRFSENYLEAFTRQKVSDTKFQLLRAATAARYHQMTQGDWPRSAAEFAPLLGAGLPKDDFATSTSQRAAQGALRFTRLADAFAVYSVGPDERDDGATLDYDPTNGTISAGDLAIRIPKDRQYPFPRGGVHAANAQALLKQFPDGLPVDPFADLKNRPLGIIDATTTQPLVVFSYGPDCDEAEAYPGGAIPKPNGSPTGQPPRGCDLQAVFEYGPSPPAQGLGSSGPASPLPMPASGRYQRALEPFYDPTNGTTSKGDLFMEVRP